MGMIESRARATSDPKARQEVLRQIEEDKVDYVLFWFTDLEGHLKSFAITPSEMKGALDDGMGFDGSSITGFNAIEESDMVAMPDPSTFRLLPTAGGGATVGRMICDVVKPDGEPYEGDPRHVLRRALERMQQMGFDTFNVGPELEYFLFKNASGTETLDEGGYFAMTALDAATDLRFETIQALEAVGIPIEYHHHEVAPSQHEIDMRYAPALDMADFTITYRLIVKEVAAKHGAYATFMPKPLFGENGSGMHTHMSLFKDGRNQFFSQDDSYHLSPGREAVHRRPAAPRARALGGLCAVGELLQAARAGIRGARLRRLVAAQPLCTRPDPALQAGLGAGDPGGDPLPRSRVQPVPDVRRAAPRRARRDRARLRAAAADGDESVPPHGRGAARAGDRLAAGDARGGDRRVRGVGVITIPAEPAPTEALPPALQPFGAVPPLVTDINLSVDDRFLYVSCWGTGELKQFDVSDPAHPRQTGSVRLGGLVDRAAHPAAAGESLAGGPQMVEVSRDGRRIYLTNSLYGAWDDQFYPDGVGAWMAKLETDPDRGGGLRIDEKFFPHGDDFRGLRVHQVRLEGGDASSDSYCYR